MIKVGDKVKFLNDVGGGVVISFINKNMVNVENEDGFEIPYPITQLLNVSAPELNADFEDDKNTDIDTEPVSEPIIELPAGEIINGKDSPDFYFCFVPSNQDNPAIGEINLNLVNDSNYTVMYHYFHIRNSDVETAKFGNVQSNTTILLESLTQSDLIELPEFGFQILYFKEKANEFTEPITKTFKVNPVKFHKKSSFQSNQFFSNKAWILQISNNILNTELDKLTRDDFRKIAQDKEIKPKVIKPARKRTSEIIEIDLHINELLDNTQGLSNREILEIQTDKVKSEMQNAIRTGVKRIVFIHGIGQGILKQEITNLLNKKFKKYRYQDASFKEYGYGATMVILRRS